MAKEIPDILTRNAFRVKLIEGTEVLRTGGGATLTASECNALYELLFGEDDERH